MRIGMTTYRYCSGSAPSADGGLQFTGALLIFQRESNLSCGMARRKSSRYCALKPISRSGPVYSLGTLSSLSPVSTRGREDLHFAGRELHPNRARPLIGELRHALDGALDLVLRKLGDVRVVLRQHALVIREIAGQLARDQQARSPNWKNR